MGVIQDLFARPKDAEAACDRARALLVKMEAQDTAAVAGGVNAIRKLCALYPESTPLLGELAKGLIELQCRLETPAEREAIAAELQAIYDGNSQLSGAQSQLARALYNLALAQPFERAGRTIERLEALQQAHPGNGTVRTELAQALTNLSHDTPDARGRERVVQRLAALSAQYPDDMRLVNEHANALLNLGNVTPGVEDKRAIVDAVRLLHQAHPDDGELAATWADSAVNLLKKLDAQAADELLDALRQLSGAHPDNLELLCALGDGLINAIDARDCAGAERAVDELRAMQAAHPNELHLAVQMCVGMGHLIPKQWEGPARETKKQLRAWLRKLPRPDKPPKRGIDIFAWLEERAR